MTSLAKKVELGCGRNKPEGYLGVDKIETEEVDIIEDLDSETWDLPSDHFEVVRAIDLIEHLDSPINFLEEVYRISQDGAQVIIQGPHQSSQNWTDPTHKRLLGTNTIEYYFTQDGKFNYYSDARFDVKDIEVFFHKRKISFLNYLVSPLVNKSMKWRNIWEETWLSRICPAYNIKFVLEVRK